MKAKLVVRLVVTGQDSWWRARGWIGGREVFLLLQFPPSSGSCRYEINGEYAGYLEVEDRLGGGQVFEVHGELEISQSVGNLPMSQKQLDRIDGVPTEYRIVPTVVNLILSPEAIGRGREEVVVPEQVAATDDRGAAVEAITQEQEKAVDDRVDMVSPDREGEEEVIVGTA